MGDSPGSDRPLKRVRYTQQHPEPHEEHQSIVTLPVTLPVTMASAALTPADRMPATLTAGAAPSVLENTWSVVSNLPADSRILFTVAPPNPTVSWSPQLAPQHAGLELDLSPSTPVSLHLQSHQHHQSNRLPRLLPAGSEKPSASSSSSAIDTRKRKLRLQAPLISPFKDCHERLIASKTPKYIRPQDGQVNGYVKFHWPSKKPTYRPGSFRPSPNAAANSAQPSPTASRSSSITGLIGPVPVSQWTNNTSSSPVGSDPSWDLVRAPSATGSTPTNSSDEGSALAVSAGDPQMLPPHFGFHAKMDWMDRRLWEFYIKNWCPGRSVLNNTNLWLTDFAKMHENEGIRCAIQSLAGVYIHDYLPDERIRNRINERYALADAHFSQLLADPTNTLAGRGNEVITMAVILSMQDIVLTERRLKKPHKPRWLEGFKQGEYFLHVTDTGGRFWCDSNVQLSTLRISQSIIVGRAVILAQPMMPLPSAATLDPEQEVSRFGWLLYGTERDMFEIHGGCGFSKKLLHMMSQITYLAARLQQARDSPIVPMTAEFLYRELLGMRQWSSESISWEEANQRPPTIDWVRQKLDNEIINTHGDMTDVTAEAWRIAAIIYLQCRVFRLPRNHPQVIPNLADLARCIRIMPTSGSHFTAQAPLLPVFLLGLLATEPDHKQVSQRWFDQVVQTPVRSSVPPLYQALMRIWTWIDTEIELPSPAVTLSESIGKRRPWWERLVQRVQDKEEETLCLT